MKREGMLLVGLAVMLGAMGEARGEPWTVVKSFAIGHGDNELGYAEEDGLEEKPSIRIGVDGGVTIVDPVNSRGLFVARGSSSVITLARPVGLGRGAEVLSALSLDGGGVVARWIGGASLVVLYDSVGAVQKTLAGIRVESFVELPNHSILASVTDSRDYVVFDRNLRIIGKYSERPLATGRITDLDREIAKLEYDGGCTLFSNRIWAEEFYLFPDALMGTNGPLLGSVDLKSGTMAVWRTPRSKISPDPATGELRVEIAHGEVVIGGDEQAYSLIRYSDRFDIVRWDLTQLTPTTYPQPAVPVPSIPEIAAKAVKVGQKLGFRVRLAPTKDHSGYSFVADPLPEGAELLTHYAGNRVAGIVWTPKLEQVGHYVITLTATNAYCRSSSRTFTIDVTP